MEIFINNQEKVCDFITVTKQWNLDNLKYVLPNYIIGKIRSIPNPVTEMTDKLI